MTKPCSCKPGKQGKDAGGELWCQRFPSCLAPEPAMERELTWKDALFVLACFLIAVGPSVLRKHLLRHFTCQPTERGHQPEAWSTGLAHDAAEEGEQDRTHAPDCPVSLNADSPREQPCTCAGEGERVERREALDGRPGAEIHRLRAERDELRERNVEWAKGHARIAGCLMTLEAERDELREAVENALAFDMPIRLRAHFEDALARLSPDPSD